MQLDANGGDAKAICLMAKETMADCLCISAHDMDTNQHYVKSTCYDQSRKVLGNRKLTLASSSLPSENVFKPGGTMMITRGKLLAHFIDDFQDPLGRWCSQTYRGKDKVTLTVVTCYQVCQRTTRQCLNGKVTAAAQQVCLLQEREVILTIIPREP